MNLRVKARAFGRARDLDGATAAASGVDSGAGAASSAARRRRSALVVGASILAVAGCSGPQVPLSVGLADRPVDLLLGERVNAVAGAPVPPVALPPVALPDFDFPSLAPLPLGDLTATPPTFGGFPTFTSPPSTLPVGCTATPPERSFDDSPDKITVPPVPTPEGEKGYITRTEGKIEVGGDDITTTILPQLASRKVENLQIFRFPHNTDLRMLDGTPDLFYDNPLAEGYPQEFTFDVVVDVGTKTAKTTTTYRVVPAFWRITYQDQYSDANGDGVIEGRFLDGKVDDFFTDLNHDYDTSDLNEMFRDADGDGAISALEQYFDLNGNGIIDSWSAAKGPAVYPGLPTWPAGTPFAGQLYRDERYKDVNGDGVIGGWVLNTTTNVYSWSNSALVIDSNGDGIGDRSETVYPNYRYNYAPDGVGDFPTAGQVNGGIYLVSMLTGEKEKDRITFTKVKNAAGQLVDAPGAKLATVPFVESATENVEAFTADGSTSIRFESTVFGRVDVDVCRTNLVAWKVALDRGFISGPTSAVNFTAEYSIASQYGGLFLEEKTTVTSIANDGPMVRRTVESVFTNEPPAGVDPDPPAAAAAG